MNEELVKGVTQEMYDFFHDRTKRHIKLVRKYCDKIAKEFPEYSSLRLRKATHDRSKYQHPEVIPYVWVTWKYKCKAENVDFDVPDHITEMMHEATTHHVTQNSHHPEAHSPTTDNLINKEDRDKPPSSIIDATTMPELDIAEMVADWCAMSEEKGGTPREWAERNVNVRWQFTDEQVDIIFKIIDKVWE